MILWFVSQMSHTQVNCVCTIYKNKSIQAHLNRTAPDPRMTTIHLNQNKHYNLKVTAPAEMSQLSDTCSQCYSCLVMSHNMASTCWPLWCSGHIVSSMINPHLEAVGRVSKKILPITFLSSIFTCMARQDFIWMFSVEFGWLLNSKTNYSKMIICSKKVIVFCTYWTWNDPLTAVSTDLFIFDSTQAYEISFYFITF